MDCGSPQPVFTKKQGGRDTASKSAVHKASGTQPRRSWQKNRKAINYEGLWSNGA
jgi:hypothetical protein